MSPPADEVRPELEHLDIHEVVFPFPSNGPQRRVVDAVDKNRIVVVQGPPGNGKSLTIANLVAHFVAEGKSVLVCSHKEQALTVVRDKLDEMGPASSTRRWSARAPTRSGSYRARFWTSAPSSRRSTSSPKISPQPEKGLFEVTITDARS